MSTNEVVEKPGCMLCGVKGRLTKEHIWPRWYSRLHPGNEYEVESIIGKEPPRFRKAPVLDFQPKVLCSPCNSDWGAELEEAVRPRLSRMTKGEPEVITLPFARQLAAWSMLKIMAAEHLVPADQRLFFTPKHGSYLRAKTKPPPHEIVIWIGQYAGRHRDAGWVLTKQSARALPEDKTIGAFRHTVAFSIGEVAFQMFGVRLFPLTEGQESRTIGFYNPYSIRAPWREALFRIWPLPESLFHWPPRMAMDDRAFDASAGRWHAQKSTLLQRKGRR